MTTEFSIDHFYKLARTLLKIMCMTRMHDTHKVILILKTAKIVPVFKGSVREK